MENMNIYLKTQGYCCQVCWVTLPVCNHEVILRATVLAIMVVMVMLMVVVLVLEKMMKKKQSTCQVDRDDQQAKS